MGRGGCGAEHYRERHRGVVHDQLGHQHENEAAKREEAANLLKREGRPQELAQGQKAVSVERPHEGGRGDDLARHRRPRRPRDAVARAHGEGPVPHDVHESGEQQGLCGAGRVFCAETSRLGREHGEGGREAQGSDSHVGQAACPHGGVCRARRCRRRRGRSQLRHKEWRRRPKAKSEHQADPQRANLRHDARPLRAFGIAAAQARGDGVGGADGDEDHEPRKSVADGARRPQRRELGRRHLPNGSGVYRRKQRGRDVDGKGTHRELEQLSKAWRAIVVVDKLGRRLC
mmetsp:Transcript_59184/g.116118  ORF Transcript_59184/g.116118 Transcript_59184/m.116118 type:complete len:288 (-) Transcript_59184:196-1059(-)